MEELVRGLIAREKRLDGRKLEEFRKLSVSTGVVGKAEGSAWVELGKTKVLAGVKLELGVPYADAPNEGVLKVHAELSPLAAPEFESGPPSEDAIELARVVDRGIRAARCIELEKLCVSPGEKAWIVHVDLEMVNHDGNLLDASALAAIIALRNAKVPRLEDDRIIRGEYEAALPVVWKPVQVTVCKLGDKFLLDPCLEEEQVIDTKLSVCVRDDDTICSLQKQGMGFFKPSEVEDAVGLAIKKCKELRKLVD